MGAALFTVGLILRRRGLGRLALLDAKPQIIRCERSRLGEMIHLDINEPGRINGVGHRFTGRGPARTTSAGAGTSCTSASRRLAASLH